MCRPRRRDVCRPHRRSRGRDVFADPRIPIRRAWWSLPRAGERRAASGCAKSRARAAIAAIRPAVASIRAARRPVRARPCLIGRVARIAPPADAARPRCGAAEHGEPLLRRDLPSAFRQRRPCSGAAGTDWSAVDGRQLRRGARRDARHWSANPAAASRPGACMLGLIQPTAARSASRAPTCRAAAARLHALRRDMQMVFQDPYGSLNPRLTVGDIWPSRSACTASAERAQASASPRCWRRVGFPPEHADRYPHEFSGGQRQRVGIARALALGAEADGLRRAGVGARRLDPGASDQPAASICKRELDLAYSSSATISRWCAISPNAWR